METYFSRRNRWITTCLFNLCLVALAGFLLRTKFLFPLPEINYKNLLSAHSHFAFGGWVTLVLMLLMTDRLLGETYRQKKIYQQIFWGIQINSLGMLFSFPFQGYATLSIIFSTGFILITYLFTAVFINDLRKQNIPKPVVVLAIAALVSLVISSIGPFSLAYMLANHTGNALQLRDAVYTFLHFQYNGFFTCAVFALYFNYINGRVAAASSPVMNFFSVSLAVSVIPSLSLSLLWQGYTPLIFYTAVFAGLLMVMAIGCLALLIIKNGKKILFAHPVPRSLLVFVFFAFTIKMILQVCTIIPSLGIMVFGFRPIIIGFLHLVFLGMVSFFVLALLMQEAYLGTHNRFMQFAILFFAVAVLVNKAILLVDGIGLLFYTTHPVYPWLLWIASILLLTGALLMFMARLTTGRDSTCDWPSYHI
jgi:hypothetical protein